MNYDSFEFYFYYGRIQIFNQKNIYNEEVKLIRNTNVYAVWVITSGLEGIAELRDEVTQISDN